jgi:molybdopterin converting factor small subunit
MLTVTVKLGGSLRYRAADPREGVETLVLSEGARIADVLSLMGIAPGEVRIILHNARSAWIDAPLHDGDRLALFPPELAFNLYVALCLARKE